MADALERVTNLLALLLETRRPLTLEDIGNELPSYPRQPSAMRGAFERDKAMLRDIGVPIDSEVLQGDAAGKTAYRIDRDRYELRGLELADDERRALQVAVAALRSTDARFGMLKLGGDVDDRSPVVTNVPTLDALPDLRDAAASRSTVRFDYHGRPRSVQPYALLLREGFWYVIGHDAEHDAVRTFRVDRIEGGVTVGAPGSFARPPDFDARAAFPADPKALGGERARALVVVDADRARFVADELGPDAVVDRRADGAVVFAVACSNADAFRSWLFGLGAHAAVVGPADVRAEVVEWLRAMAAAR